MQSLEPGPGYGRFQGYMERSLYPTRKELHRSAGRKRLPEMQPVNRHSEPRRREESR